MIASGIGFDAHRLVAGRRLVLGGVEIEWQQGLDGHSDADVLSHAIADALLGAAAAGDIGKHFPDTEEKWRGASSLDLLAHVKNLLTERGASILNVDATVIAEQPKLAPYIGKMQSLIAEAIGIDPRYVSIKATTVEQMGAIGRGEGMAAMAVATLDRK